MTSLLSAVRQDPEVTHNRDQTLGLSSCPEDDDGAECELCSEQVDRLVAVSVKAALRIAAERARDQKARQLSSGAADNLELVAQFLLTLSEAE